MKYVVQAGLGQVLTCCSEKFVVDFALEIGVVRQPWHSQQSKLFYENLRGRLITQFHDTQRGLNIVFAPHSMTAISWLAEFFTALEPGYLATSLVRERLMQLEQGMSPAGYDNADDSLQRDALYTQLFEKMAQIEHRLQTVNLLEYGRQHYQQVLSRWNDGDYLSFSPAGRCYVVLQELYWGAFGEAIMLGDSAQKTRLIEEIRTRIIDKLANEVSASPHTRHYYQQWFTAPFSSTVLEHKDTLAWLGDACNIDQQPVSYSVTQAWLGISLGMPRICSAMRLGGALVDEIFLPD